MTAKDRAFIKTVLRYYETHGRHELPWRTRQNPYRVLVSEVMLQQTQVERVRPKYQAFLRRFPTTKALALAPLGDVLLSWQGLGYNRRAKLLWECARVVHHQYRGRWPREYDALLALPGVGPYTAAAVMAFAYDVSLPLIETNVRTVYLHHFFPKTHDVTDREILTLVQAHLAGVHSARVWYAALMDYGSYLKRTYGNPNHRARTYAKQEPFKGSDRQLRGLLLRLIATKGSMTRRVLIAHCAPFPKVTTQTQIEKLLADGLLREAGGTITLPV